LQVKLDTFPARRDTVRGRVRIRPVPVFYQKNVQEKLAATISYDIKLSFCKRLFCTDPLFNAYGESLEASITFFLNQTFHTELRKHGNLGNVFPEPMSVFMNQVNRQGHIIQE
jgi:hypothetical protein